MTTRVIRKYANRRLYDSKESRHLTLDEVRQLVVDGERLRVEDAKTGEDLTRSVLLQIIVEREEAGGPLLSFSNRHEALREQFMRFVSENPVTELTRRNLALWEKMQNQMLDAWVKAPHKDKDED